ncbi:DNA phosphorothioation system sulfurtransferase DndC [uncultured Acetobacterium sp.]|uniref:DNA phosphorothioation system sulfurtransferase DndC n=1 Tax=uncultured Acetobacterium sp. TaxID=217139 RepID=UPI0025E38021|nr:DNA phosphorothioation system sulfurtransferase DndC [uncultured Acetobacterium sp.]
MSISKSKVNELQDIIRKLYLEDSVPWVIGYSGGKDSTATLQLVWMALLGLPAEQRNHKDVHVISTDTLVESPIVAKWVENSLKKMSEQAKVDDIPIVPHRLIPDYNDTFWVNLLGRGYPYPRPTMRWCTDRLKIKPANTFVQNVVSAYGEAILVLGTRKAESSNRARTMKYYENMRVRDYLSPNGSMQNELVFTPLEDWSDDDVWYLLMQYKNPWGHSNKDLLSMYKGATADNECPLVINTDTPSCGKSRFGCWVCTLVEKDKSMAAMIINDSEKEWMSSLLNLRNYIGNPELDRERRDFRRMTGKVHLFRGRLVHGPYKKEVREEWLRMLLEVQRDINQNGPDNFRNLELISNEELNRIRQIWLDEKHEFDDSLPVIYKDVIGTPLEKQLTILDLSFGKTEWELLEEVCQDKYPNKELLFEMVTSIIDVESKSAYMKNRHGILTSIETLIRRSFYQDEEDALAYAIEKIVRKKKLGAVYDTKAGIEDNLLDLFETGEDAI